MVLFARGQDTVPLIRPVSLTEMVVIRKLYQAFHAWFNYRFSKHHLACWHNGAIMIDLVDKYVKCVISAVIDRNTLFCPLVTSWYVIFSSEIYTGSSLETFRNKILYPFILCGILATLSTWPFYTMCLRAWKQNLFHTFIRLACTKKTPLT